MDSSDTDIALSKIAEFEHVLAEFVMAWNRAERVLRLIVNELIGGTGESLIVVVEMGNRALDQALRSYSRDRMDDDEQKAVAHMLEFYNRVLAHRNYVVHSVHEIFFDNITLRALGQIYVQSAKRRLVHHEEHLTTEDLRERLAMTIDLLHALTWMQIYVDNRSDQIARENLSLREFASRHPLPASLAKPQSYPLSTWQPGQTPQV